MKGRPWYRHYPGDFLHGTMALTAEQKGAYITCLDLMYDRGGPIPDDASWLARQCGCSTRKWNTIRKLLIAADKLHVTDDGKLRNGRVDYELHRSDIVSADHSARGKRGGRPSKPTVPPDYLEIISSKIEDKTAEISNNSNEINWIGFGEQKPTQRLREESKSLSSEEGVCIPEGACSLSREQRNPTPIPETAPPAERKLPAPPVRSGPRRYDDVRIELDNGEPSVNGFMLEYTFEKAMEDAGIDPARSTATYKPVVQWLADGYNTKQIRAAIRRVMERGPGSGQRPIMSLAYFDKAVRDQKPEETPMRRVA